MPTVKFGRGQAPKETYQALLRSFLDRGKEPEINDDYFLVEMTDQEQETLRSFFSSLGYEPDENGRIGPD